VLIAFVSRRKCPRSGVRSGWSILLIFRNFALVGLAFGCVGLMVVRQLATGKRARRNGTATASQARPVIVKATLGTATRGSATRRNDYKAAGFQRGGLVASTLKGKLAK
jgi:hypothetical protein